MPDFKNIKELEKYLQKQISESLQTDVAQNTKQLMKEHIEEDVYNKYSPTMYIRRAKNGGLLDDANFLIKTVEDGVSITNIDTDDGYSEEYFGDWSSDPNTWLIPIIEYGTGYNWTRSKIYKMQPYPRPFVENTRKDLRKGKLKRYMKDALKKRGFIVEK
jgi:hypothetical protein